MLLDWFTVAAQIVNFLILALLLRRFLFKPVTKAIADRKQKIATELSNAAAIREEAQQIKNRYEAKFQALEKERNQLLDEARQEAEKERQLMFTQVKKETEELRSKLMRSFNEEQLSIQNQIATRAQREVFALAKKTMGDLASQELENYLIDQFLRHLDRPEPIERQQLKKALDDENSIVVRTAFSLDPSQQKSITKALRELIKIDKITPEFEIKPELICGIEVQINHYKMVWHVAGYLREID